MTLASSRFPSSHQPRSGKQLAHNFCDISIVCMPTDSAPGDGPDGVQRTTSTATTAVTGTEANKTSQGIVWRSFNIEGHVLRVLVSQPSHPVGWALVSMIQGYRLRGRLQGTPLGKLTLSQFVSLWLCIRNDTSPRWPHADARPDAHAGKQGLGSAQQACQRRDCQMIESDKRIAL